MKCDKCGHQYELEDIRVTFNGMYDMHLFTQFKGSSVDEVIEAWREHNSKPQPAIVGDRHVKDLGKASLCPASVSGTIPGSGKTVSRRVGKMVFPDTKYHKSEAEELSHWRDAVESDPDIKAWFAAQMETDND